MVADTVSFSESSLKGNITISLKIFEDGEEISHVEFQTINELSQVRVMVPTSSDAISNLEFVSFISPVGSDHYRVQFSYTGEMWSSVDNGGRVGESFSWSSKVEVEKGKEEVLMRDGSITYTLKAGDELQKLGPLGLEE
ncbi:hypothetical protein [Puniceicoccus vermicola]|uniref:hypothetical protein n=1 Tax=Puniceicoccus vermicola TaxID=388746 RepID=UPI00163B09C8|nr:hypothetical protein [Puniceicoccus vermicola]